MAWEYLDWLHNQYSKGLMSFSELWDRLHEREDEELAQMYAGAMRAMGNNGGRSCSEKH